VRIIKNIFIIAIVSGLLLSCNDETNSDKLDCSSISCTFELRSIVLEITDAKGGAVILDDYHSFIGSRTKFKIDKSSDSRFQAFYPVATDSNMDLLEAEGTIVIFVGIIDGKNVVEHQMLIGKDCCHIQLIEGATEIVVE